MKITKRKYILQTLVVVCILAALLVSMNGCKKKKADATEPSSTGETTTETTGSLENTQPSNNTNTNPSEDTNPTETTNPTDETEDPCVHVLGNWIVDERSNCTKEGLRYKACTLCEKKVVTEIIPKTTHTESDWIDDKYEKASCTAQGKKYKKCTQCDEVLYTIVVDKTNHNTRVTPGRAANTATTGLTDCYWCRDCNFEQKHYVIPAVGSVPYDFSAGTIKGFKSSWAGSELILPSTIDGKTVTAIDDEAFSGCNSIKTVYIPKTVKKIGDKAFSGCSALTTIVYEGTMEEWLTSVAKGELWNQNTGSYEIICNNRILSK